MNNYDKILLISDLDGTLLNDDHDISPENEAAIKDFEDQGGLFTFATGRMAKTTLQYIDQLDIRIPVIVYNGAAIYDPLAKDLTWKKMLTDYAGILDKLVDLSHEHRMSIQVYQNAEIYYTGDENLVRASDFKERTQSLPWDQADFSQGVHKILMTAEDRKTLKLAESIVAEDGYACGTVYSEWNYFELVPQDTNKGEALRYIIERYKKNKGLDLESVAVGNNQNDLPMLKEADYGFYVKNSDDSLFLDQLYATVSNNDHAIADVINDFIFKNL